MSGATASKISLREQPILMRAAELSDATGPFPDQSRGVFPARDGLVGIRAMSKDAVARYASGALRQPQTARGLEQRRQPETDTECGTSAFAAAATRGARDHQPNVHGSSAFGLLAACLYGHEPAGDGRADWGRRHGVARRAMI